MSYLQETHALATHVERIDRGSVKTSKRSNLVPLLFLAFLHGALYAFSLPPWGLIDEAQHLHYIQYIAEEQSLPVAGELYLSDEIVDSLFATRHWDTFHWKPPADQPQLMGLEGYSYEAYQPPLFYLLMTPLYLALPQNILLKVYGLRAGMVVLSLITVWALYRTAELLFSQFSRLPFWAGVLLVAIPERAMATSRINNDVLLEVICALFMLTLTHAAIAGLATRRSLLLGLLLGLGVWVKVSAGLLGVPLLLLLWLRRHDLEWRRQIGWIMATSVPLGLVLVLRNLWLYGDLTGFSSFEKLHRLALVDDSFVGFVSVVVSVLNHFWLVWWKGSNVGGNWLLTLFYGAMAVVVAISFGQLCLNRWQKPSAGSMYANNMKGFNQNTFATNVARLMPIYGVTVFVYTIAVISSYEQGMVPVIQGRFMLPAIIPFLLLLVYGLWLYPYAEQVLLVVVVLLWGMGLFSLFGNLIPYFYYWSEVVLGTMPPISALRGEELLVSVYQRALLDKPSFFAPLLVVILLLYGITLLFTLMITLRSMIRSR